MTNSGCYGLVCYNIDKIPLAFNFEEGSNFLFFGLHDLELPVMSKRLWSYAQSMTSSFTQGGNTQLDYSITLPGTV